MKKYYFLSFIFFTLLVAFAQLTRENTYLSELVHFKNTSSFQFQKDISTSTISYVHLWKNTGDQSTTIDPLFSGVSEDVFEVEEIAAIEHINKSEVSTEKSNNSNITLVAPVFDPPPADITVECIGDVPAMTDLGWTDCDSSGTVSGVDGPLVGGGCEGTITRTWSHTSTGACGGETTSVTQTITVDDTTNPTAPNPAAVNVQCSSDVPVPNILDVIGEADNCTAIPTVAFVSDTALSPDACGGTITRTYSVTDDCLNQIFVTQTITVDDTTNPTAPNPAAVNVQCSSDVPVPNILDVIGEADNCTAIPTVAFVSDTALSPDACGGTITRTYSVTDDCLNQIFVTQTITVDDTTNPTAPNPAAVNVQCSSDVPVPNILDVIGEADNCTAIPTVAFVSDTALSPDACGGTITRTYSVTDDCLNQIFVTQTITVDDTTNPTAPNPAAVNVQCSSDVPVPNILDVIGEADNCTAIPTVAFVSDTALSPDACGGTITRTYSVTDDCLNQIFVTQTITVDDTTNPTAPNPAAVNVQCSSDVPVPNILDVIGEADNCTAIPTVAFVSDTALSPDACGGTITRTYSVTDDCLNQIFVTQTITVDDTTNPTAPNPAAVNVQCSSDVPVPNILDVIGEADNCTAIPTVAFVSDTALSPDACGGTITRTYSVTDDCLNQIFVTQTITVDDTTNPTAPNPAAVNVQCSSDVPVPNILDVIGEADNCTAIPTVAFVSDTALSPDACGGTITRTYSVTDDCLNQIFVTQTITVDDTTNPTAPNPAAVNVQCSSDVPVPNILDVIGEADNCTAIPTVAFVSDTALSPDACGGTITRTYSVTDDCLNQIFVTQTITVDDTTNPTAPNPAAVNVQCSSDVPVPNILDVIGEADNCTAIPTVAFVSDTALSPDACGGTITRTYSVTDDCLNQIFVTQTITVDDTTNPTAPNPAAVNVQCSSDVPVPNILDVIGEADNCTAIPTVAFVSDVSDGNSNPEIVTRTYSVTDDCLNQILVTQTITINDTMNPVITGCPSNITQSNDPTNCSAIVTWTEPTATDNCTVSSSLIWTKSHLPGAIFTVGTTTVTYSATDEAGNTATCSFDVTITDNENPTITCASPAATYDTDNGQCNYTITSTNLDPTVTGDNCGILSVLNNITGTSTLNGAVFPVGITTVIWTVTDTSTSGNTATCQYDINVEDNEAPILTCPTPSALYNTDAGQCDATLSFTATATDNCNGSPVISYSVGGSPITFPYDFQTGTTRVDVLTDDGNGQTATCNFNVVVNDNEEPVADLAMLPDVTGECTATVSTVPTSTDNCSGGIIIGTTTDPLTYTTQGTHIITWSYDDGNGNIATQEQDVVIDDITDPVTPTERVLTDECSVTVTAPTTTDNCAGTITGTTGDYSIPRTFNRQGTYPITWEFDDGNGNTVLLVETVIIDDVTLPIPDDDSLPIITKTDCMVDVSAPTATDNCEGTITGEPDVTLPITTFGTTIITWTYDDDNGNVETQTQSVTLTKPAISGGTLLGYVTNLDPPLTPSGNIPITACPDDINHIHIDLSDHIGTIVHWEKFEADTRDWEIIPNTSNFYEIDFDFSNTKSTVFRVLIQVGTCTEYSTLLNVHGLPPTEPPILEDDFHVVCLDDQVTLIANSGYTATVDPDEEEAGQFDQGQFFDKWNPLMWKIDGEVAGVSFTGAANNRSVNNWTTTNNHPFPDGGWEPKIEYDSYDFKFAIAQGDYTSEEYIEDFPPGNPSTLETPIMSLVGLESALFSFDQAWNLFDNDIAKLELSTDGGTTYNIVLQDMMNNIPAGTGRQWDWAGHPSGNPSKPNSPTYFNFLNDDTVFDLSDYLIDGIAYPYIRIRWTFYGNSPWSTWAVDNIKLPLGGSPGDVIEWTDGIGDPNEAPLETGTLTAEYNFYPDVPGFHQYGATVLVNGCRAYDPDGTAIADVLVNYAYAGEDVHYNEGECGENEIRLKAYDNRLSVQENAANGSYDRVLPEDCSNCDDDGTMAIYPDEITGEWSIVSEAVSCGVGGNFSDINDPNALFSGDPGTYTLRWTVSSALDEGAVCSSDVTVQVTNCDIVDFDGINDNVTFRNNYNLASNFSIETWIKPNAQTHDDLGNPSGPNDAIQTIISKRDVDNFNTGYDLRLEGNTISFNYNGSGSISSPYLIGTDRWYHIAVTYKQTGKRYKLYIDGIEVNTKTGNSPNNNNMECILGAMDQTGNPPNPPVNYFSGWIDEVRIWNVALDVEQLHQMMNQEIKENAAAVHGEVIPLDITGLDANTNGSEDTPIYWSDLEGYYRMDAISCGYLQPNFGVGVDGKLRNITTSEEQTAPLPYFSAQDGIWNDDNTWLRPVVWDPPNSIGVDNVTPIDWNIAVISHDIESSNKDITVLGLLSDTADKELTISEPGGDDDGGEDDETNTGHRLWVTHYLLLDGTIDLIGESQLLQKRYTPLQFSESTLDVDSGGHLERDQQGQGNIYRYNDWSSPVGLIGQPQMTPYSVQDVLWDGFNSSSPQPIGYIGGYDGNGDTTPIQIAEYWIYAYKNFSGSYYDWVHLMSTGTMLPGEGFTMKGSHQPIAALYDLQNFVFIGKPHNGDIQLPIGPGNSYLTGNPYPSAIDADQFIVDNLDATTGTLYFWDDWEDNTHLFNEAHAGYAIYTLAGGVFAPNYNDTGELGTKRPQRYIPIAQGFFVDGDGSGGTIKFNNNQRAYITELDQTDSQFFKPSGKDQQKAIPTYTDNRLKIWLGFDAADNFHREILLTIDERTTDSIDKGFDAIMEEPLPNDMFFVLDDYKLVIQAIGDLSIESVVPIGIKSMGDGSMEIKVDSIANPYPDMDVYLRVNSTMDTYDIKNGTFEITLEEGIFNDKYSLVFKPKVEIEEEEENVVVINELLVFVGEYNELLRIKRPEEMIINNISLFNMIGQQIQAWDANLEEQEIDLPIHVDTGVYVVLLNTNKGRVLKKVFIE